MHCRPLISAAVLLLLAIETSSAHELVLEPFKAVGIYALGEKAGWTAGLPSGSPSTATYRYTVKKNNFDVIKTGTLDLSKPQAAIEVIVNEPAMLYVEVDDGDPSTPLKVVGAAIAPDKLKPSVPAPKDFDRFWKTKIAALRAVPANPVITSKPSGKPIDVAAGFERVKSRFPRIMARLGE